LRLVGKVGGLLGGFAYEGVAVTGKAGNLFGEAIAFGFEGFTSRRQFCRFGLGLYQSPFNFRPCLGGGAGYFSGDLHGKAGG
jgi:hypothetical protein